MIENAWTNTTYVEDGGCEEELLLFRKIVRNVPDKEQHPSGKFHLFKQTWLFTANLHWAFSITTDRPVAPNDAHTSKTYKIILLFSKFKIFGMAASLE